MRRRPLCESRLIRMAVGASMLTVPASAAAGSDPSASPTGLRVAKRHLNVTGARPIQVWGKLLPALPGHRVRLQALSGRGWETLTTTRTGKLGRFDLRFQPHSSGRERLRVQTAGGPSGVLRRPAGTVTLYRQSTASWYYDAGQTACGFHARYGVANLSLPCGTKVTFMNGGRTVTAVVDDRGPYVAGREWDLNQSTAAALGFYGVGGVWSTR
jgi:rare lipoprotein A